jgi:5-oxoprolinase (ATP-hydrolysing) subunit A
MDVNADVGEWPEPDRVGVTAHHTAPLAVGEDAMPDGVGQSGDQALLTLVTSAHVACGFHAGGPSVMRRTVEAAVAAGVVVGAHPSYPDLEGFGRRDMERPPEQVADDVLYQVGALDGIARACGTAVRSVKPHGALYHRMTVDRACARAVAGAVRQFGQELVLVVPAGSSTRQAAEEAGVPVVAEAFCDRAYAPDGSLVSRSLPGALILDPHEAARRAVSLATTGEVVAVDGTTLRLACDTLCVHGDTPGSVVIAAAVRRALEGAGVRVSPFVGPPPQPAAGGRGGPGPDQG